jgi:hypothetical protein
MRIGLVGCVKSKLTHAAAARDLYTSQLFRGGRCAVERSCERWFILSALHGLVEPDRVLEPYERTLTTASPSQRRAWSERVLGRIEATFGTDLSGHRFEAHAGRAYLAFGLVEGLEALGATVEQPLEGLGLGKRRAAYKAMGCREHRAPRRRPDRARIRDPRPGRVSGG